MHCSESHDSPRMIAVSDMTTVRIGSAGIAWVIRARPVSSAGPRIRAMDNHNNVILDALIKARLEIPDHRGNVPVVESNTVAARDERAGAASQKAIGWEPCFVCTSTAGV